MNITSVIIIAANKVGVSASLLLSICTVESGLRPVNNFTDHGGGSFGICQVQNSTAREIVPWADRLALQQPELNAYIAATVLKKKINKYGEVLGIASYNSGSPKFLNGVLRNKKYVDKVQKLRYNIDYGKEKNSSKKSCNKDTKFCI